MPESVQKLLRIYVNLIKSNDISVRNSGKGQRELEQLDALAKTYGLLLPKTSLSSRRAACVANRTMVQQLSRISKESTFGEILKAIKCLTGLDYAFALFKIYQKENWDSDRIRLNSTLRSTLNFKTSIDKTTRYDYTEDQFWRKATLGKTFQNRDKILPTGVTYTEWDATLLRKDGKRDAERFVRGSDKKVYYTSTHYSSFVRIY